MSDLVRGDLSFRLPGWETSRFETRIDEQSRKRLLVFHWTLPDSDGGGHDLPIRVEHELDGYDPVDVAFWLVCDAVLHEAGEHFYAGDERPYHPHTWGWWFDQHRRGMPAEMSPGERREV